MSFNATGLPALILMLVVALIWVVPLWRLLPKFGLSKWLSFCGFVPVFGGLATLVLIWVIAFREPVCPTNYSREVFE